MNNIPSMTAKGKTLLGAFPVNGSFYIGVYQGSISPYDVIIRYRQKENNRWGRLRTPKHIHWAIDILIKQYQEDSETSRLLDYLINLWDNHISPWTSQQERDDFLNEQNLMNEVNAEALNYPALANKGEYSVKFLILLAKLLMVQEKTNRHDAYMFRKLLVQLKNHDNIFRIVSTATFR